MTVFVRWETQGISGSFGYENIDHIKVFNVYIRISR